MKCGLIMALGAMGIGCSVPEADQVTLERLCAGRGAQAIDGVLRAAPGACDRGLDLTIQSKGFSPGCIRVALWTADGKTVPPLELRPPPSTGQGATLHVAVLLPDTWKAALRIQVDAFEQTCDTEPVTSDERIESQPNQWEFRQSSLELLATDADGDGFVSRDSGGTDCNDSDPTIIGPQLWYRDADGDGYGNDILPPVGQACVGPALTANRAGDCNDSDLLVHPNQAEFRCDGKDDNCDNIVDEGFNVGDTCTSSQGAHGVIICDPADPTRTTCSGS